MRVKGGAAHCGCEEGVPRGAWQECALHPRSVTPGPSGVLVGASVALCLGGFGKAGWRWPCVSSASARLAVGTQEQVEPTPGWPALLATRWIWIRVVHLQRVGLGRRPLRRVSRSRPGSVSPTLLGGTPLPSEGSRYPLLGGPGARLCLLLLGLRPYGLRPGGAGLGGWGCACWPWVSGRTGCGRAVQG